MKSCLRVPRIFIPRAGFEEWAVIACDQFTSDRAYWERVARNVGDAPSTLRFILPEVYLGEEDESYIAQIHENMYRVLEEDKVEKLARGWILTERTTKAGVRRGIVAAIDLEQYTFEKGVTSPIRSSEEVVPSRLPARVQVRRGAPLEFPHAVLFYRDKKDRAMRRLQEEELEQLYDFDLMEGGGHLKGYFIYEELAEEIAHMLYGKNEPAFAVADGNHSVAAAKAYWEEVKATLNEEERLSHPARFTLVELENIYDEAVVFHPIHRIVKGIEADALCDYFGKKAKCKRDGNLLYPALASGGAAVAQVDGIIEEFVKQNGGTIDYIHGLKELKALAKEDCVGIVLKSLDKDDFFDSLKGGKNFPKKTFSLGEGAEKRYYFEGREIGYD